MLFYFPFIRYNMKTIKIFQWLWLCLLVVALPLTIGCSSDDEEDASSNLLTIAEADLTQLVSYETNYYSFTINSRASWKATLKEADAKNWLTLVKAEGVGGTEKLGFDVKQNTSKESRTATIVVTCQKLTKEIVVTQAGTTIEEMSPSEVANLDKYYKPAELGNMNMFRNNSQWSWYRHKQSEHFFVFWEPGFGADPNSAELPSDLRVDIDDLLVKAEQFYKTNVEKLKFAEVGQGKSYLDKYKMEIYLFYQTDWMATGSGYGNTIGALWINPGTCQPVGSTIAHEIGHSFQYQVACDKLLNGTISELPAGFLDQGFRYGYTASGEGGNAFWEQCAQWQSFQDYPGELFGYHVDVWKANYHRHFNHEWMRYASYWMQYYWIQKHGIDAVAAIWKESKFPDDPLTTYQRLYCGNSLDKLYEDLYDYAARMVTYDIDVVRNYVTNAACDYSTKMFDVGNSYYQVGYASCPGTSGFNIIPLNLPESGNTISAVFEGLATGSALAGDDPGSVIDGDGKIVASVSEYNSNSNTNAGWRYGFVAVVNGKAQYSPMYKNSSAVLSYDVPNGTTNLYMVVMGAPDNYQSHPWDDDELNDAQWPYKVKFENTNLLGSVILDPDAQPKDITLTYNLSFAPDAVDYTGAAVNLNDNGDIAKVAQAFVMQPSAIKGVLLAAKSTPAEGKIVFAGVNKDGSLNYSTTANGFGFWFDSNGDVTVWGSTNDSKLFGEFSESGFEFTIGQYPGKCASGDKYTIKEALVYKKNGELYRATFVFNVTIH